MNWKYPTFVDWNNHLVKNNIESYSISYGDAWNAARATVDDADLDQPATLEWVRGRAGWEEDDDGRLRLRGPNKGNLLAVVESYGDFVDIDIESNGRIKPTRRQVIAAETFAKEMGWM